MIVEMPLSELQKRCGGKLIGDDVVFDSVSTDSRKISEGDLYLALRGDLFDGHQFVELVADQAAAFVLERDCSVSKTKLIVEDSRYALGAIGAHCRDHFTQPVVAITGSSGKTTTRNMLSAILRTRGEVCTTIANQNNEIGVPLTLMTLSSEHVAAVVELGARRRGDISYLGQFVRPDVSILLNAGTAHIGEFGGYENIVLGKGEIYDVLGEQGVAIVNVDDPASEQWLKSLSSKRVLTYSLKNNGASVFADSIVLGAETTQFRVCYQQQNIEIVTQATGVHNVSNAMAACAAALSMDVDLESIAIGLSRYQAEEGRLSREQLAPGIMLINDAYNANPASMKAGLDVLTVDNSYRIAVLGEMAELGSLAEQMHLELAEYAANSQIEEIWLIGQYAEQMASRIGSKATVFKTKQAIANALADVKEKPVTVLLKASRFVALEEVANQFKRGHV